jgi:hypothetical protein
MEDTVTAGAQSLGNCIHYTEHSDGETVIQKPDTRLKNGTANEPYSSKMDSMQN